LVDEDGTKARALYDYVPEQSEDLQLNAGHLYGIMIEDDGSGWTKGQDIEGHVGIFPTSYIEYV
jgi:hypothetical protein